MTDDRRQTTEGKGRTVERETDDPRTQRGSLRDLFFPRSPRNSGAFPFRAAPFTDYSGGSSATCFDGTHVHPVCAFRWLAWFSGGGNYA